MKKITLQIKGMHCESCAKTIEKALLKEKGIFSVDINFALESAIIEYEPERIDEDKIREIIARAGYEALEMEGEKKDEIKIGRAHV